MVYVSWGDAMAYCRWLTEATGRPYTLPSEAEWEKAARGPDGRIHPWGDVFDRNKCNTAESGIGGTTPVGRYSPAGDSPYGVADMTGNVWEWTRSLHKLYPYRVDDGREDPAARGWRVVRGGYWSLHHAVGRCAFRDGFAPETSDLGSGFRCCCAVPASSP